MARLFITPREIDFIADMTKEIVKDVIGQKIYYYRVREDLTDVHDVYEEAPEKVFDPPIEVEALVEWAPEEVRTNRFASEEYSTITVSIQSRDLLDKKIQIQEGDFFSYGVTFFEVTSVIGISQIFGQVERPTGVKLTGKQAREGLINVKPIGPTSESHTDADAVQDTFAQQRGLSRNRLGATGDKRQLVEDGTLEAPITGQAAEVSKTADSAGIKSSFYGDDG